MNELFLKKELKFLRYGQKNTCSFLGTGKIFNIPSNHHDFLREYRSYKDKKYAQKICTVIKFKRRL
jgi:hypothetical protein